MQHCCFVERCWRNTQLFLNVVAYVFFIFVVFKLVCYVAYILYTFQMTIPPFSKFPVWRPLIFSELLETLSCTVLDPVSQVISENCEPWQECHSVCKHSGTWRMLCVITFLQTKGSGQGIQQLFQCSKSCCASRTASRATNLSLRPIHV